MSDVLPTPASPVQDPSLAPAPAVAKRIPRQARARATYESLLRVTGELLAEVGIERISTNLIVEKAGVTPPAFYRYFEDKYHALSVLGARLMDEQNQLIESLAARSPVVFRYSRDDMEELLVGTVEITRAFPGGAWLTRALRAVPQLQHIRVQSHREMSEMIVTQALAADPTLDRATIYRQVRLTTDMGYAAVEMVFEEPDLDVRAVMRETATAIAAVSPFVD